MQQYTGYLYLQTALHVSGGISTHHHGLISLYLQYLAGDRGSTVVKVLCYKSEGRWFDPSLSEFFIHIKSFRSHYGPGVDSASNRNEYQENFLGVKAAGALRRLGF